MKINLLSCDAAKPDRRAIANCINLIALEMDESLARELTEFLMEGEMVEIEVADSSTSSAYRSLRKLSIDYELIE